MRSGLVVSAAFVISAHSNERGAHNIRHVGQPAHGRCLRSAPASGPQAGWPALAESPLTSAQADQLVAILSDKAFADKMAPNVTRRAEILARAGGVLSASQLQVLKKEADRVEASEAMSALSKLHREQR